MKKPADTSLNIHPIIKKRWSPRTFADKPVEKEKIQRILEAGRWAPSSFNEQPWRFMIGFQGDATWGKLHECMVEFNQLWAGKAPVLLLAIGNTKSAKGGKNAVYEYDVGQSMAYITFQLEEEGLVAHQMGGFSKDKAIELFSIPDDHTPIAMMAIGYHGKLENLNKDFQEMEKAPRDRKALSAIVFADKFGDAAELR